MICTRGFMDIFNKRSGLLGPRIVKALEARQFEAHYCANAGEARERALGLIPQGAVVSWGGSVTLNEIGLLTALYEKNDKALELLDRDKATNSEERFDFMRRAFFADVYLTSVNGLTEDGVLVNVDGLGNRVAALSFGPKMVIGIVGMNKVCKSLEEAESRVRNYAAPMNAQRLSLKNTPCSLKGACGDCLSAECMCATIVKTRFCKVPRRIKIILVGEPLGY
jgi:L-lactate utilization protein LutB